MQRLDKILSAYGGRSRAEAKALIKSGVVRINGASAKSPDQKIGETDIVTVHGIPVSAEPFVYYMMNKPADVLSATSDPECRTVLDLLPPDMRRKGLFPAGRLDKDTEGFVLITDDGGFAHKILSPKNHVPKTYFARLDGPVPENLPPAFEAGLDLGGGDVCSSAEIKIIKNGAAPETEIVIYEGMYHQVKRMFQKFSLEVVYLKRIKIGNLSLDENLPPGGVRKMLYKEIMEIYPHFRNLA